MDFEDDDDEFGADFNSSGSCDICGDPLYGGGEMLGNMVVCESCYADEIDLDDDND